MFIIAIAITNAMFFGLWLKYMFLELLKITHKHKRVFMILSCGLIDYQIFKIKYMGISKPQSEFEIAASKFQAYLNKQKKQRELIE